MALQLTGAFKDEALANLQVELPALVIGGGLTAIDTATELLAYYPLLAEKTLRRYEALVLEQGETAVRAIFDREGREALDRFLHHGTQVRKERERARRAGEEPDFPRLCREWGGVSIVYRRKMEDSPAYRLNHEEIIKALEEGISFVENLEPEEAVPNPDGRLRAIRFRRSRAGDVVELPARSAWIAAGTTPNITYEKERPGSFPMDVRRRFFLPPRAVPAGRKRRLEARALQRNGRGRLLHRLRARRKAHHFFRRQPSGVQRQRRQSHGLGAEGLWPDYARSARRQFGAPGRAGG